MHTLGDMAKTLNRPAVYLSGLQTRFELPAFEGAAYSDAYLAFLRGLIFLRTLNVGEDALRDLWRIEKKLLQLLHVESTGSKTWFLDHCGEKGKTSRRLLSHYDMGVALPSREIQLGLNFAATLPELFAGKDVGEDALRALGEYLKLYRRISQDVKSELSLVRDASRWAGRLK